MTYAQFEEENARAQSAEEKETDDEAATSEEQILQHKKLFLDAVLGHPNVEILNSGIKKVPMLRVVSNFLSNFHNLESIMESIMAMNFSRS